MRFSLAPLLLLAACAPVAPVETPLVIPTTPPPERVEGGFDRAATEADLLATARKQYGQALVQRAIAAPAFIFTKHYRGMMPPPPPDAGPDWKYPEPRAAMLFREAGQWLVATDQGVRAARPDKLAEIEAILANPKFRAEPDYAAPGCTDSGASLLMVKSPERARITRRASCGATQLGENLVFRALEA